MTSKQVLDDLRRWEIPGRLTCQEGNGGLPKLDVQTDWSSAEIYLHGAQVTRFQKRGEAPLLFCSQFSRYQPDSAIRGGVPLIFPWFGAREGQEVAHGFARTCEWQLHEATALPRGGVSLRFHMPEDPRMGTWPSFSAVFAVTVGPSLDMEMIVTNTSNAPFTFENCFHTYFHVGDIREVRVRGLAKARYADRLQEGKEIADNADAIEIAAEVDRTYHDSDANVEIEDRSLRRRIFVEKSGSSSTVVWNPWIAKSQRMADFGDEEYKSMICVESGNIGRNEITIAPGEAAVLKVTLSSTSMVSP